MHERGSIMSEITTNIFDDVFGLYWDKDKNGFKIFDKESRTRDLVLYQLDRSQQIFVWKGLPDTIPQHNLETLLQINGNVCIAEVTDVPDGRGDAGLYAFFGGLGGLPNAYYEPTIYAIANPYLNFNKQLEIGTDCVRMRNDKFGCGLLPMFVKYGAMMNENEISMNMLSICYRIDNLISADNDTTFESAKEYLNDIIAGQFGLISSPEFFEGIRNDKSTGSTKSIKDLIEYEQYLKASWFNEIGLNSNYNMKRERLTASESELTDDALIPLVDNMLSWRLKACEEIKEMFGDRYDLDGLTVELNRVWDLDKMYEGFVPESDEQPEENSEESTEVTVEEVEDTEDPTEEINEESEDVEEVSERSEESEDESNEDVEESEPTEYNSEDINININISTNEEKDGEDDEDTEETN